MEADQNQQEPEAVAPTQAPETLEESKSEEVNETPSPQNPPEPEKPAAEAPEPEAEVKTAEVDLAEEKPEPSEEPVKEPEKEKEAEEVPKTAVEPEKEEVPKAAEPEKKPLDDEPEKNAENDEPEKEPANEPEKKAENDEKPSAPSEEKGEPEEPSKTEPVKPEAAAVPSEVHADPVKEEEKAEAPKTEAVEKPAEEKPAKEEQVQAEPPKEEAAQPKEAPLPLFYGWFLLSEVEERIRCSTMDFLKTLDTLEVFKKHINDFTGEADKEVDLEQYFQSAPTLHCTTMFCDYGKAKGAKEYAELQVVKDSYDTGTELSVVGLIVTPRTFGARVALTPEQLPLWPTEADKEGVPTEALPAVGALPPGSRAHVTLGCASDVEPVRTGLDLLDILVVLQGEKVVAVEEMELGTLSYLGQGRWYLSLREAVTCDATFLSHSEKEQPAGPAKKEGGEKKKNKKCSIL